MFISCSGVGGGGANFSLSSSVANVKMMRTLAFGKRREQQCSECLSKPKRKHFECSNGYRYTLNIIHVVDSLFSVKAAF